MILSIGGLRMKSELVARCIATHGFRSNRKKIYYINNIARLIVHESEYLNKVNEDCNYGR